jgi:Family of unknown function (DUF6055)
MESDHFVIHYGLRNPREGRGRGSEGVRDRILVLTYVEALEHLHSIMTDAPWNRPPPVVDLDRRTHVFVFDTYPFTDVDPFSQTAPGSSAQTVPYIVLPCRNDETSTQAELQRAAAEAVHEATHVFNFTEKPDDLLVPAWEWYDEGFAVFMETLAVAGNPDYVRFLKNWIDRPEVPLDHRNARYQAGMFVRYLARRLGHRFVNEVWTDSAPSEGPFQAIQRMLPPNQVLISPDPKVKDLFASGYCMDPFFLWDHASAGLAPEVFARFGERAITDSLMLKAGAPAQMTGGVLDHLACRYYRFYLKGNVSKVWIALTPGNGAGPTKLKAEVAAVTGEGARTGVTPLHPPPEPVEGEPFRLTAWLNVADPGEIDHLILVVTNCGTRPDPLNGTNLHDDYKDFTIEVAAS